MFRRFLPTLVCIVTILGSVFVVSAQEFQSASFNDYNPVIEIQAGRSTSNNFEVISGTGQTVIGESNSGNFIYRSGFYYFPTIVSPSVVAVAGDTTVALSWTAASASLGWNVSAYEVGQATNSNGPFSYANVGNVLLSTRAGLSNGTTYYFIVRALDAYGSPIATSSVASATPAGAVVPPVSESGGGGGGGQSQSQVIFAGQTAPAVTVYILEGALRVGTIVTGQDGSFTYVVNTYAGTKTYTLFAERNDTERSGFVSFVVNAPANQTVSIDNITFPPFLTTNQSEVKQGDTVPFNGFSAPNNQVFLIFEKDGKTFFDSTRADDLGNYIFNFDTTKLPQGIYTVYARLREGDKTTDISRPITIKVGEKNEFIDTTKQCGGPGDFNCDKRVDLVDFSILLYWFDKTNVPASVDLNNDGRADLVDFSILMYYWTS